MYAILRAAFMSDEPVRGAPSIDAFSVEKVENDVRQPPVSPHSLSFFRSLVSFRVPSSAWTTFDEGTRDSAADSICARATRDERIYDLSVIFVGQGLPFRFAIYLQIAGAYVSDFRRWTRHLLQIWPRLIIRREMCTASTRYWVTAKMKVRQSVFFSSLQKMRASYLYK